MSRARHRMNLYVSRTSRAKSRALLLTLMVLGCFCEFATLGESAAPQVLPRLPAIAFAPVYSSLLTQAPRIKPLPTVTIVAKAPAPKSDPHWKYLALNLKDRLHDYQGFTVSPVDAGVEIVLASDTFFQTGTARISQASEPHLHDLASWLSERGPEMRVAIESHTDDTPVVRHRRDFATNWELSAARAGALAGVFENSSFPGARLQAIGLASTRPLGAKRSRNRRIVIRLSDATEGG